MPRKRLIIKVRSAIKPNNLYFNNINKFTNVKRAHDKTTKWFWKERLDKHKEFPAPTILFNCALFRYFGTIEFSEAIGWIEHWPTSAQFVKDTAKERLANKERVFTGAYVITNQGIKAPKQNVVVDHFLTPLWEKAPTICNLAENYHLYKAIKQLKVSEICYKKL